MFGTDADYPTTSSGCGPDLFCLVAAKRRYWNGTVTIGGGSGAAYADYVVSALILWSPQCLAAHLVAPLSIQSSPFEAISLRARKDKIRVDHVLQDDPAHYPAIKAIAHQSELCFVFASLFLVEGWDREHLRLDKGGEELIKTVERSCAGKVVVVLHTGGQVVVEDWVDLPNISGVIWAGYPGEDDHRAGMYSAHYRSREWERPG